jgi:hypothetical protein
MVSHRHRSRVTARKYDAGICYEFSLLTQSISGTAHHTGRLGAPSGRVLQQRGGDPGFATRPGPASQLAAGAGL